MKKLFVIGSGESGTGAAILASKKGMDVFVSDAGQIPDKYRKMLDVHHIPFESGTHTSSILLSADEIVKSPGIPDDVDIIRAVRKAGIPVISEIEFAARFTEAKMICITGSNGKTTTTLWIWHILHSAGLNVGLAGNVGNSFALQVADEDYAYYVIELSSFQLDNMYEFKADIAVLLNITPDHLDRYEFCFDKYVESKFRILQNQEPEDVFIFNADDPVITKKMQSQLPKAQKLGFSYRDTDQTAHVKNNDIILNHKNPMHMSIHELALQGKHNTYNSMAAGIVAQVLHIRKPVIRQSLMDFKNVEHRLEMVYKVHGISFINDSKATNINSAWYALESMNQPVVWIVGGVDKGNDYSLLEALVEEKVKAIVCLGKDNKKLHAAFEGKVSQMIDVQSMEEAVASAYYLGRDGDVVLLSPACASFDLFDNYEDRGNQFKQAVSKL